MIVSLNIFDRGEEWTEKKNDAHHGIIASPSARPKKKKTKRTENDYYFTGHEARSRATQPIDFW